MPPSGPAPAVRKKRKNHRSQEKRDERVARALARGHVIDKNSGVSVAAELQQEKAARKASDTVNAHLGAALTFEMGRADRAEHVKSTPPRRPVSMC